MTAEPSPTQGSAAAGGARHDLRAILLVVGLTVLAAGLRLYRLNAWSLEGDEIFTLRDSLTTTSLVGPKPLLFLLNHYLIAPWTALDETGLRILPALFGVLAVPVMYWLGARLISPATGAYAALLVAVHPWHVFWSQFARYYSLVFLLSAVAIGALVVGVRTQRPRWIAAALAAGGTAVLAHPSAGLLACAGVLWVLIRRPAAVGRMVQRVRAPIAVGAAALAVVVVFGAQRLLGEFAAWQARGYNWGHRGPVLLLGYVDWVSPAMLLCALGGIVWTRHQGERPLAALLALTIALPAAFLLASSSWISVSTSYLFATAPAVFLAAGAFLARLGTVGRVAWERRLVCGVCVAIVVWEHVPRLVSHYRDGSRLDFRSASRYLDREAAAADLIVADQSRAVAHYLPGRRIAGLVRAPTALSDQARQLQRGAALWILSARQRRGGFNERDLGGAASWVRQRCELAAVFGRTRLDYKHNEIEVYRCRQVAVQPARLSGRGW